MKDINKIYERIRTTPKEDLKEPWEKALKEHFEKERRLRNKVKKFEKSIDPNDFEYKDFRK